MVGGERSVVEGEVKRNLPEVRITRGHSNQPRSINLSRMDSRSTSLRHHAGYILSLIRHHIRERNLLDVQTSTQSAVRLKIL